MNEMSLIVIVLYPKQKTFGFDVAASNCEVHGLLHIRFYLSAQLVLWLDRGYQVVGLDP